MTITILDKTTKRRSTLDHISKIEDRIDDPHFVHIYFNDSDRVVMLNKRQNVIKAANW